MTAVSLVRDTAQALRVVPRWCGGWRDDKSHVHRGSMDDLRRFHLEWGNSLGEASGFF